MIELVSRASTGKIRVVQIKTFLNKDPYFYIIQRYTGQYKGKMTEQPLLTIKKGKASRTIKEQFELELKSIIKKYLDKGYKKLTKELSEYTEEELNAIIGEHITGQAGVVKPMLAKQADKVTNKKVFDKNYFISRKINGVRCLIYWNGKQPCTSSRGAISYDIPLMLMLSHPKLIKFFKNHPNVILDGEIYKHGWTLNKISGICRKHETVYDGEELEFYWYDIVEVDKPASERIKSMLEYSKELELKDFNPYMEWQEDDLQIQLLPQEEISGWDNIMDKHNQFVSEGWEGAVIRLESGLYGPNKRTNDMLKVKVYQESEYEIVGLSEGLREEDMCFTMKTPTGQEFKAKPMGDRLQKQWYRENIDKLIGKLGTLKYFEMSGKEGSEIPQQPIFICVRDYE